MSLVDALKEALGNVFSMYVRTHGAHWNVRGSDFAQYHELFETIYEDVYGSIDPLAENLRKLDADAPATLSQFNELDGLADASEPQKSEQELTKDIMDANRIVLESLQKAFNIANKENEQGIANFLAERIDMHQKWNWQLSSSLSKKSSLNNHRFFKSVKKTDYGSSLGYDPLNEDIESDEYGFEEGEESFAGKKEDNPDVDDTPGFDVSLVTPTEPRSISGFQTLDPSFDATRGDNTTVPSSPKTPKSQPMQLVVRDNGGVPGQTIKYTPIDDVRDTEDDSDSRSTQRSQRGIETPRYPIGEYQIAASIEGAKMQKCAACGSVCCDGHASDSIETAIIVAHASGDHSSCDSNGCDLYGRTFHAHVCTNCGGDTPCNGIRTASVCDTFDGFCKTCFVNLAGIREALDSQSLNEHMRKRNTGHPPVTQAEVDRAMGEGHSLETAREEVGPHRPTQKEQKAASKQLPEWLVEAAEQIENDFKLSSNECGTCGHSWSDHGTHKSCSCCVNFKKGSTEESGDSFVPPTSVASNAKRGLELRKKYHRGGTEIGVARARDLSNRKGLSYSTIKRMKAYFDRHEVDKKGEGWGKDSAGYIAWLLWGGDAGRSWANKIIKQHEKKKQSSTEDISGDVIDFVQKRKQKGLLTPDEVKTIATETEEEAAARLDAQQYHPSKIDKFIEKGFGMTVVPPKDYRNLDPKTINVMKSPKTPLYDQDEETNPIPNGKSTPSLGDRVKQVTNWLGLTDGDGPYDQNQDWRKKSQRSPEMQAFLDALTRSTMPSGMSNSEAVAAQKCVSCGEDAKEFDDDLSEREFKISGLCQNCQNDIFKAPEE